MAASLYYTRPEEAKRLLQNRLTRKDPLSEAVAGLTPDQRAWLLATNRVKVCEGGNQSGKTWLGSIDFLLDACGLHPSYPSRAADELWRGWYATITYSMFSEQGWAHFKRLLLWPGESVHRLPTRRILEIGWHAKNPEMPTYVKVRRGEHEAAEIWIKSYEQGVGTFQSAGLPRIHLDEECPESIWTEVQMRGVARAGRVTVSATPVLGVPWLARLRTDAETHAADVFHQRLDTRKNPAASAAYIEDVIRTFRHAPEMIDLRLGGFPLALSGLVYPDTVFRPEHVVDPHGIMADWSKVRWIDPGWNSCACLWAAVGPRGETVVYRDYLGHEKTVQQNAAEILRLSGREVYQTTYFDPYYIRKHEESGGERLIDLWRKHGVPGQAGVEIGVMAAIQLVWELLQARVGMEGEAPKFTVFRTCADFLDERRGYRWKTMSDHADDGPERPLKKEDHLMDCWKGLAALKLSWRPPPAPRPAPGTTGELLWKDRRRYFGPGVAKGM